MTNRLSRPRPANCGYYGKLSTIVDGKLLPSYTTPEFDPRWGLFKMANHLQRLAINMNADAYQLRRCLGGNDRPSGCVMMLTEQVCHD